MMRDQRGRLTEGAKEVLQVLLKKEYALSAVNAFCWDLSLFWLVVV